MAAAMTVAPDAVKPGLRCPALYGDGVDMRLAAFTFVVEKDCENGVDQLRAVVEVFGFFCQPGQEHDDDLLQTGCLAVPPGTPIARIACEVSAVPDAVAQIESILRADIAACPCTTAAECPALTDVRLLEAIEDAAGNPPRRRSSLIPPGERHGAAERHRPGCRRPVLTRSRRRDGQAVPAAAGR
jgi:hypothetical protein